jgi:hypothetical protein
MPFSFPSDPSIGQQSTQNDRVYKWTGYAWEISPTPSGIDASNINTGVLANSRLSTSAQSAINLYLWSSFR